MDRTTDPESKIRTYIIMLYRTLQWDIADKPSDVPPVIGVGDGVTRDDPVPDVLDVPLTDIMGNYRGDINDTLIHGGNSGIVVFRVDGTGPDEYRVWSSGRVQEQG